MKERMQKVKNYVKENKTEILKFGLWLGYGFTGYLIGWHYAKKTYYKPDGYVVRDDVSKRLLGAIDRDYPKGHLCVFAASNQLSNPISVNDLGKLGELFKESGCPDGDTFTHFLAVGDAEK